MDGEETSLLCRSSLVALSMHMRMCLRTPRQSASWNELTNALQQIITNEFMTEAVRSHECVGVSRFSLAAWTSFAQGCRPSATDFDTRSHVSERLTDNHQAERKAGLILFFRSLFATTCAV